MTHIYPEKLYSLVRLLKGTSFVYLRRSSKSHQLISMTAQTMSNAPVHKFIKRDGLSEREKGRRNGQEERAVDDSRILDGWSLIFGRVPDSERTRFVYVDSTPT